ncbi:formate dehydrogenase accessory protein FdhE [Pseudonocardia acaciae]|uniref:formate dehydrogenase accessory protein FdhE domain-containing protein n=1 Tax=Pseudonocardia acaciae TaxID=551276 RepID=UPI00048F27F1|nr:formate dehydrogenase accessory protein FdhE [Pseudonocardia acaciae]
MSGARTVTSPWADHRRRAAALRERHEHAAEMLTLYLALLDVWEQAWPRTRADPPAADELAGWAEEHVLPHAVEATERHGPPLLVEGVRELLDRAATGRVLRGWLAGEDLTPVERYLARAVLRGPLETIDAGAACARDPAPRNERSCPRCAGPPQLSLRADAKDGLVAGRRRLACARCGTTWAYSASSCACCGETDGARRTIFAEHHDGPKVGRGNGHVPPGSDPPLFPHLRIEACQGCSRYLIDIDAGIDPLAVAEVDELTALPLDLYAAERGLTKITPNLMGF